MAGLLEFQNVAYTYPQQEQPAVRHISFGVQRGAWVGVLGANDSGKSTLAKLANGLLMTSEGQVLVDGTPIVQDESVYTVRQKIGVVFADPENQIVGTTVEEEIAFGPGNLGLPPAIIRRRVDHCLARVGLTSFAKRAPHQLSGGEQQKLCMASVLAMEPDCLVLDDPLTFLDPASRQAILELIDTMHAEGATILYFTSDPEELVHADRILLLAQGNLLTEGTPADLWNTLDRLEQAGIEPSDLMRFRAALRTSGAHLHAESLTIEAMIQDLQ